MCSPSIGRDGEIADVIVAIGKESVEAKNSILSGKTQISRKHLREMSSDSEERIAKTASEIASGTFEEKPTQTHPNPPSNSVGNPTNNHPLTAGIIIEANKFINNIQTLKSNENSKELKKQCAHTLTHSK